MARVKPGQLDGGGLRAWQPKPAGDSGKTESLADGSASHRLCGELKEAKRVKPSRNRESNQEVGFTNQFTRGGPGKTEPPSPELRQEAKASRINRKEGDTAKPSRPHFFASAPVAQGAGLCALRLFFDGSTTSDLSVGFFPWHARHQCPRLRSTTRSNASLPWRRVFGMRTYKKP